MTLAFTDSFLPFLETTLRKALERADAANDLLWKMQNDTLVTEKVLALQARTAGLHQQHLRSCQAVLRSLIAPAVSARARPGASPTPSPLTGEGGVGVRISSPSPGEAMVGVKLLSPSPSQGEGRVGVCISSSSPGEGRVGVDSHSTADSQPPIPVPAPLSLTQNSALPTPHASSPTPHPPTPIPPSGSAPLSNSRNFEKILEKIPHDLAWRPSKDRLLCRRQVDAKQKAEFTRLAGKHVLYGPTVPFDDGWPLEAQDWMLAADIFDRKKDKLPVPTAWEVVKIRSWLDSFTRLGGGDPNLKQALRDKLPALESAWREELKAHFSHPEDATTLQSALQAFGL